MVSSAIWMKSRAACWTRAREAKPANATLNRELAIVTRAFRIAVDMTPPLVGHVPRMPTLKEGNVRTGFLEDEQYRTLLHELPDHLQLLCDCLPRRLQEG
jgi:hypothetical protein